MKRKKNYRFAIVVCCQGQPFYYYRNTLFSALIEYAYHYLKKNKYGTMNFTLKQVFDSENIDTLDGFGYTCTNKTCHKRIENKAIDNFVEKLMKEVLFGYLLPDGMGTEVVTRCTINEIAEQLKR